MLEQKLQELRGLSEDPAAFEEKRGEILEEFFSQLPPEKQEIYRALQAKIEEGMQGKEPLERVQFLLRQAFGRIVELQKGFLGAWDILSLSSWTPGQEDLQ